MSIIICEELPQFTKLDQKSTDILIKNNCALLIVLIVEIFPIRQFTISTYYITSSSEYDQSELTIFDIQFLD